MFRSWKHPKGEDSAGFGKRLESFVSDLPKPCGILAANDEMAVHVLRAAEGADISVPQQMAVMGIDNEEIIAVRVARAKDLLRNSKISVNEIYLKSGYRDPRSLRAVFTKATGCSLLQWRARKK